MAQTVQVDYKFAAFPKDPAQMREHRQIPDAYASLRFGEYRDFGGAWMQNSAVVWLNMIVANRPGQGKILIDRISKNLSKSGITIVGDPAPFSGRDWEDNRLYPRSTEELIQWYIRRDFQVVQSEGQTRVMHLGLGCKLKSSFRLV